MRWSALFADLESQLAAAGQAGLEAEAAERTRSEYADLTLVGRLGGQLGRTLDVRAAGIGFSGILRHIGRGWILLEEEAGQALISLAGVAWIGGLDRYALSAGARRSALGLGSALRGLSRERADVAVYLDGAADAGQVLRGRLERVGGDFFELSAARADGHRSGLVIRTAAVAAVRAR